MNHTLLLRLIRSGNVLELRLLPSSVRFVCDSQRPPVDSIEALPEWKNPLEDPISRQTSRQDLDQEMEDFFEKKSQEERRKESLLFKEETENSFLPDKDGIQEALAQFEKDFKNSDQKTENSVLFTSKFSTFRSNFAQTLSEVGLESLPDAIAQERSQSGLLQDFMNELDGIENEALVSSFFGNSNAWKKHQRVVLKDRKDLLEDNQKGMDVFHALKQIPQGGFRISIYRNVTGSIKQLLISLRNEVLPNFLEKTKISQKEENQEFLSKLIDSLEFSGGETREVLLPRMNQLCVMFLERLPELTADEIALVCLVFGKLSYVNSLIFHRLFTELQKPEVLSNMSHEGLFGTVLSLGMLQSTEPEFLNSVQHEFERRFTHTQHLEIPKNSLGSLLFGSSRSKDSDQATSLANSVLEVLCKDEFYLNEESVSWADLALALYVTCELKIWKPELIRGIHQRLLKTKDRWDLKCMESAGLLMGLENQPPSLVREQLSEIWNESYSLLEDCVEKLLSEGKVQATSVPDLVRSFSLPGHSRVHTYEAMGKLIVSDGEIKAPLPLWSLCYRLMAGYMNNRYRDPEVLAALNKRFLATKMGTISSSTIIQLLHSGLFLRGLEETMVDRIVELMSNTPHFWSTLRRPKDAAKAAYALAGLQKLNPKILNLCWEQCNGVKFFELASMNAAEAAETVFIAQGLFSGYQYISNQYSAEIAQQQIPDLAREQIFEVIRRKHLFEAGPVSNLQREVSDLVESMGIGIACPAIILDGLYSVDIALLHAKAVVFATEARAFYCNQPTEMTGRALMHYRELEGAGVKVILIFASDCNKMTPDQRKKHIKKKFEEQGLDLQELKEANANMHQKEVESTEESKKKMDAWLRTRSMVLSTMKVDQVKGLLKSLQNTSETNPPKELLALTDSIVQQSTHLSPSKAKKKTSAPTTKAELIQHILAFEADVLFGNDVDGSGKLLQESSSQT